MRIGNFVVNVKSALLVVLSMLIVPEDNSANELPTAPSGFSWYESKNGVGTFLKPNDWYVHEEEKSNTLAIFISRESISESGRFSIGLSVNKIPSFSSNSNKSASTVRETIH